MAQLYQEIYWTKYSRMDQIKFVEDNLCLNRPYPFKFCKGCLPQILLGSFLNTLSHINHPLSSTNINMENHKKWPILVVSGNTNKNYILIHFCLVLLTFKVFWNKSYASEFLHMTSKTKIYHVNLIIFLMWSFEKSLVTLVFLWKKFKFIKIWP